MIDAPSRMRAAILNSEPMPLSMPAVFRSAFPTLDHRVMREYADATGYPFAWGQLIEQSIGDARIWRIVPVKVWEKRPCRAMPNRIPDILDSLQPWVRARMDSHLPQGAALAGCQGAGRRCPHALFSLLLTDPDHAPCVRHWLAGTFLDELLPQLLTEIENYCRVLLPSPPQHAVAWH